MPSSEQPDGLAVAVAQTAPVVGDKEGNLADAESRILSLAGRADLVVFPELFTTGYRRAGLDHAALAEPISDGPSITRLGAAASRAGVAVIGTILERGEHGEVFDTAIAIDQAGELRGRYRKTHLYPAEREYFSSGDSLELVELAGVRIGLAICFEHAFPEIFTALALRGASLVAIPSAVPVGYEYLIDLRTRARAQDNQLFVVAANLAGFDGETRWCGLSAIVDPKGEVVVSAGSDDPIEIIARLDLGRIVAEREQEPSLRNRRPELYSGQPAASHRP